VNETPTRILVVEDEPGIALGLEDALRLEGYDVELVANGIAASARARDGAFDLIVLDVMLPGKSGLEICRELRQVDERTPVILLTARSLEQDRIGGLDVGANDYVTKPFSSRELLARIRGLLRYVATSRRNEARFEDEFRRAREAQERLLPGGRPSVQGLEYACACRPARRVSGDYYDFVERATGRFAFLVADVSGKGMSAALLGATLQGATRSGVFGGLSCGQVLAHANQLLFEETCHGYATVFLGIYDAPRRVLTYANAGHYPPFLMRGATFTRLGALTPPVGMFPDLPPDERVVALQPEDWLLVASDGIPEAANAADEQFGDERLAAFLDRHRATTPVELCDRLLEAATVFGGGPPADDMTVLAARVLTES
jgi:phosphoserine phosphatase RsbU/P